MVEAQRSKVFHTPKGILGIWFVFVWIRLFYSSHVRSMSPQPISFHWLTQVVWWTSTPAAPSWHNLLGRGRAQGALELIQFITVLKAEKYSLLWNDFMYSGIPVNTIYVQNLWFLNTETIWLQLVITYWILINQNQNILGLKDEKIDFKSDSLDVKDPEFTLRCFLVD